MCVYSHTYSSHANDKHGFVDANANTYVSNNDNYDDVDHSNDDTDNIDDDHTHDNGNVNDSNMHDSDTNNQFNYYNDKGTYNDDDNDTDNHNSSVDDTDYINGYYINTDATIHNNVQFYAADPHVHLSFSLSLAFSPFLSFSLSLCPMP